MNGLPFPYPTQAEIEDAARRHRVRVSGLEVELRAWGLHRTPPASLDEAGERAYAARQSTERAARLWAEQHMRHLDRLAREHGVSVQAIIDERRDGDHPDERSAAQALAARRGPGWLARLRAWVAEL
ncbi:hypothetical protein [Deinococcus kurensis]|uniref:hypothetical protein n=1 Tax=Deinococcus kurensis TaxID=2662757 RepID=UPI0012D34B47|nr:hypothetical protein [Deinococcus kurensis]